MAGIRKACAGNRILIMLSMTVAILFAAFPANSNAQLTDEANAALTLTVQKYVAVAIDGDITMSPIDYGMFQTGEAVSIGQAVFSFATNTPAYLYVPKDHVLTRVGPAPQPTFNVITQAFFFGWASPPPGMWVDPNWRYSINPGSYTGATLGASLDPSTTDITPGYHWAGTYQGTVTLTITAL